MTGTLVNILAILVGGSIGLLFRHKLPEKATGVVFQGIGLVTMAIGITMFLRSNQITVIILAILSGGVAGAMLQLESRVEKGSIFIMENLRIGDKNFAEGLVTSFLLFCMGAMTILGALEEGLGKGSNLLVTKAVLDGFSSIALAATLGSGVLFAVIPLFLFQGSITLFASQIGNFLQPGVIDIVSATGGVLLCGLALNMLKITRIKTLDLLPAIIFAFIYGYIYFMIG